MRLLLPYLPKLVVFEVTNPRLSRLFMTFPIERETKGVVDAFWQVSW